MTDQTRAARAGVASAYAGAPLAPELIPSWADAAQDLSPSGYSPVEIGYGRNSSGMVWVAVAGPR
ncbi:hypothetical protein ACFYU5_34610 [Nocardia aobensis]|uniref:Uncharacterized protein n=1 Tax=Nocardia aobensis TaxID=257277 RepID=A0ABW6PEL7_9NOCA|nr:hypothetical protein [Nocardia elegans]MBF6451079.1 hypothetical protein [Nocardia elegans]